MLRILLLISGVAFAQDPLEIVRRSVERDQTNFERSKDYTYQARSEEREYDSKGNLKKTQTETFEVIVLAGAPYERLIERDGKPLSAEENRKEQEKIDKELRRRQKNPEKEQREIQKRREQGRRFLREIPEAYNFKLAGEEMVSGQDAWIIDAEPKPGFKPKESRAGLLSKLRARLWIGKSDYQWVKVDAEAIDTLSFGGFIVRIAPGARIQFEQVRVNDEVWLPKSIDVRADARLALIKKLRGQFLVTFSNYKKFQTDSRVVAVDIP